MKTFFLFFFTVYFFGTTYAVDKIYQIDGAYAIVADNREWRCEINKTNSFKGSGHPFIYGEAIQLPLLFECHYSTAYRDNFLETFQYAQVILREYSRAKNTIFTNVHLKEDGSNAGFHTFDGIYFEDSAHQPQKKGYFMMYLSNKRHLMLIKFKGGLLDVNSRDLLCKKVISLITPLVSTSS